MRFLFSKLRSVVLVSAVAAIARFVGRRISTQSVKNNHGKPTSLSQTLDSLTAHRGAEPRR